MCYTDSYNPDLIVIYILILHYIITHCIDLHNDPGYLYRLRFVVNLVLPD